LAEIVLVLGGVRSGKSAFAEKLAAASARQVLYLATARAGDAEMAARIAAHRARRPAAWLTVEAPLDPAAALAGAEVAASVVLLDCVGMLVSNILLAEGEQAEPETRLHGALDRLLALVRNCDAQLIAVSSEAGLGMLPLSPLGRRYLDLLGDANQRLAAVATRTYLVVAGLVFDLRRLAPETSEG
jgi:adenosylcobinamide kinase/adenosylcobinamide-phosphate guanylyltransferase